MELNGEKWIFQHFYRFSSQRLEILVYKSMSKVIRIMSEYEWLTDFVLLLLLASEEGQQLGNDINVRIQASSKSFDNSHAQYNTGEWSVLTHFVAHYRVEKFSNYTADFYLTKKKVYVYTFSSFFTIFFLYINDSLSIMCGLCQTVIWWYNHFCN